jgi:hypothetical protein
MKYEQIIQNIDSFLQDCLIESEIRIAGNQTLKCLEQFLALLNQANIFIAQSDKDTMDTLIAS